MDPEFFRHFGLYIRRHFLNADECAHLIDEIRTADRRPATVREGGAEVVDDDYRRTRLALVSNESVARVERVIAVLKPSLEQHFRVTTTRCRRPDFLVYRKGDFFKRHADSIPARGESDGVVTGRKISVVLFLNGETSLAQDGGYVGGALEFYGLIGDTRLAARALPLTGEQGLLVAFRPEIIHGVAPVIDGDRYTAVTWFEA